MAEYLVIRLGEDVNAAVECIVVDDNGTRHGPLHTGTLAEVAAEAARRAVIVLVPATSVLTTCVQIPVRSQAKLQAALPFALEEQLAEDVENLHFAAGSRRSSGMIPAAVVAHEQMRRWLNALSEAGIDAARLVPENYGLARIPGTQSVLVAGRQIMFNDGGDVEFVMQDVKPSDALAAAGFLGTGNDDTVQDDEADRPASHLLVYCAPGDERRFQYDWDALRHELDSVDIQVLPDGVLPRLAVTVAAGAGVNLLQGPYGARTEFGTAFRPWRNAALLLIALAVVGLVAKGADYMRLSRQEAALREQFTTEYREIRPNDTREVMDPVGTVNSIRRSLGTPTAPQVFLPSLEALGKALQQHSATEVEAISYRAGVVDVRLTAPDVATLDNIQKLVSASGRFTASIQSTDQVGDKVNSRIQIREAGA